MPSRHSTTHRAPSKIQIVKGLTSDQTYYGMRAQYPHVSKDELDAAIDEAVRWRNKVLVPARAAQGKTVSQIAWEFGLCKQRIVQILADRRRDTILQEEWGGLQLRTVNAIQRNLRCPTFAEFKKRDLSDHDLLAIKGIGIKTIRDIRRVVQAPASRS